MPLNEWMAAEEASDRLGVRAQTLYAYVSRGRVRVRPDPRDPRRSLYQGADIAALLERKARSRKVSDVAAGAIAWGEPVLASEITTVAGGRLFYRGRDAITLAESETLESVARLLRGGHGAALKDPARAAPPQASKMRQRAYLCLAIRAAVDPPLRGREPLALRAEATGLLGALADAVAGELGEGAIHDRLGRAWGLEPGSPDTDVIRRILVLVADHELNASAFAARVAASTGASLAACALAGLATLSGPRHGGAVEAVRTFIAEADQLGEQAAIAARLRDDRLLPGFGHPLYPNGDPRAAHLLGRIALPQRLSRLQAAVMDVAGLTSNIDFALLAACTTLRLRKGAPFALFSVARCAGWIAHAIEQSRSDALIRPRARYIGPEPEFV